MVHIHHSQPLKIKFGKNHFLGSATLGPKQYRKGVKEYFKIHIIEYCANQGIVFPKISSYCKDHAIQGFVNQGPTVT